MAMVMTATIHVVPTVARVVARTGIVPKAEAYHRRRSVDHARGRSRYIDDARRAFHIDDLRRCLDYLSRDLLINGRGISDGGSIRHGWRLNDRRSGLRAVNLLSVHLLSIGSRCLVNSRGWGGVNRLPRSNGCTDQRTRRGTDNGALSPMVAIMTTDQATRDSADDRATADADGRPVDLRLSRADASQRERDSDKDGFHFVC